MVSPIINVPASGASFSDRSGAGGPFQSARQYTEDRTRRDYNQALLRSAEVGAERERALFEAQSPHFEDIAKSASGQAAANVLSTEANTRLTAGTALTNKLLLAGTIASMTHEGNVLEMSQIMNEVWPEMDADGTWGADSKRKYGIIAALGSQAGGWNNRIKAITERFEAGEISEGERNNLIGEVLLEQQERIAVVAKLEEEGRPGGGENRTQMEAAQDTVASLSRIFDEGGGIEALGVNQQREAALALETAYPFTDRTRQLSDRSFVTFKERDVPNIFQDFAKDVLGDAYSVEKTFGENLPTEKELEEERDALQAADSVKLQIGRIQETIQGLGPQFFGGLSVGVGVLTGVTEWSTGMTSQYNAVSQTIDSQIEGLIAFARPLIGEGKVVSDYDIKRLERLSGKNFWATPSSFKAAMVELENFANVVVAGWAKRMQRLRDKREGNGDGRRVITIDQLDAYLNSGQGDVEESPFLETQPLTVPPLSKPDIRF